MVFVEAWQNGTSVALAAWAVVAMMVAGFVHTGLYTVFGGFVELNTDTGTLVSHSLVYAKM